MAIWVMEEEEEEEEEGGGGRDGGRFGGKTRTSLKESGLIVFHSTIFDCSNQRRLKRDNGLVNNILSSLFLLYSPDFLFFFLLFRVDDVLDRVLVNDVETVLEMRFPDLLLGGGRRSQANGHALEAAVRVFGRVAAAAAADAVDAVDGRLGKQNGDGEVGTVFRSEVGSQDFA